MTLSTEQLQRLADFVQETKDIQFLCASWSETDYCNYINQWMNPNDQFAGYVKDGGDRPIRPHP